MRERGDMSYEQRQHRRLQLVYARRTRQRRVFFDELTVYRKQKDKKMLKDIKKSVGPAWYQGLSVPQRYALDTLERSIYQDLLEDRPTRTSKIIKILGIYPRPSFTDLMTCNYLGRADPKEMLAQLFVVYYGHAIDGKRSSYCLNGKILLSSILYLGLENMIDLLRERFRPEPELPPPPIKPKPKVRPPSSPYLQQPAAAVVYYPTKPPPNRVPPLPNMEELNELATAVEEDELVIPKPPPPPPPPLPPKNRLPTAFCNKIAGVVSMGPELSLTELEKNTAGQGGVKRMRAMSLEVKKTYGLGGTSTKKPKRKKKLVAPSTGMGNAQYLINGVYTIHNKTVFVLGSVTILPPDGDLIHGGHKYINGEYVIIHCGFRARPPPPKPEPCDCMKQWHETVFKYVKTTKCYCGHLYDYGNEGSFLSDEVPFFEKPTGKGGFMFNFNTIYNLDPKQNHIDKEFKKVWETDSLLQVDVEVDGTIKKDKQNKKIVKKTSTTCLGQNPKEADYLRCALRLMRRQNLASRLPDVHLAPELREWMRRRIHGPFTPRQKEELKRKSTTYWQFFHSLTNKGFGHRAPASDPQFSGRTTWKHKQKLNEKFTEFTDNYKLQLYRSFANVNNLMWATMYQAEFPNKKFREIYFSYLFTRREELTLMHPYSTREASERYNLLLKKRYICPPAGADNVNA